ncbi:MAG: response regulator [Elusimicrobiota bacterium]
MFPVGASTPDAWKPAGNVPELAGALRARSTPTPIVLMPPPPLAAPEPTPAAVPAAPAAAPVPAEPDGPKLAEPCDKMILIVDDDESVRSFIEMCASMQGFQIMTAVDGNDATAKIALRVPDLIITDLMMPGLGGYEFLRSLQGGGSGRIPIFVVTGCTRDDSTIKMIRQEANVVEFVAKPIKIAALVQALHKHLKTAPK